MSDIKKYIIERLEYLEYAKKNTKNSGNYLYEELIYLDGQIRELYEIIEKFRFIW